MVRLRLGTRRGWGRVAQKNTGFIHGVRFTLEAGGEVLGSMNAEEAPSMQLSIQDAAGSEIGKVSKTWAGIAKEVFTNADNYVVRIHRSLEDPLRSLVIAAARAVDIALRQNMEMKKQERILARQEEKAASWWP